MWIIITTFVQNKEIGLDEKTIGTILYIYPFTLKGYFELEGLSALEQLKKFKECSTIEVFLIPKIWSPLLYQ